MELLVDVALALGVSVDALFDPLWLDGRRARMREKARSHTRASSGAGPHVAALCIRSQIAAPVIVSPSGIVPLERRRIRGSRTLKDVVRLVADDLATLHEQLPLSGLILEPGCPSRRYLTDLPFSVHTVSLEDAKSVLLPGRLKTHAALFRYLAGRDPALQQLARFSPYTNDLRLTDRWRLIPFIAAALGLAYIQRASRS